MESLRVGAGAAYAGDRLDPAADLAMNADLDYMAFECLAERTIALAEQRQREGGVGYNELLDERVRQVVTHCMDRDVTVVTNMGAADPRAAAERTCDLLEDSGRSATVASITGSDVVNRFDVLDSETVGGEPVAHYRDRAVSAHAYLGVDAIVRALDRGADIVIGGRLADPSLFLAPLVHEFDWSVTRPAPVDPIGQGIAVGHLLECAGQLTGGYFADPGRKDVEDLADLGFPYAAVTGDGQVTLHTLPEAGGELNERTCTEQLLYETTDPTSYVTPDGVVDFSGVTFDPVEVGADGEPAAGIAVEGAAARRRPETLKVNLSYEDGWVGIGEISYAGANALGRAELAGDVIRDRLDALDIDPRDLRIDFVGFDALHGDVARQRAAEPYEVRLRVAAKCDEESDAQTVAREVERLYNNGPAGGGGGRKEVYRNVGIVSTLVPRTEIETEVRLHG